MPDGSRPLVGRDAEMARLDELIALAAAGRGALVVIRGEAGIGKSRLLGEVAARARAANMTVLSGRAVVAGGPYRPIAEALLNHLRDTSLPDDEALRPYLPALGRIVPGLTPSSVDSVALDGGADPALVLGEGVLRALRLIGGEAGSVLLLDDLQWIDADSVSVLQHLADAVGTSRVLVVVAARSEDRGPTALSRLSNEQLSHVATLQLARLRPAEVHALANEQYGRPLAEDVLQFLVERSEGLPFIVEELVAGLREAPTDLLGPQPGGLNAIAAIRTVPPSFAALVASRLDALTPEQRRVIETVAVLGTDPPWALLPLVTGLPEPTLIDALRDAHAVHLLASGPTEVESATDPGATDRVRLRWRHALTRDAVLAGLLPIERAAMARAAADRLVARQVPEVGGRRSAAEDDIDGLAADLLVYAGEDRHAAAILLGLGSRAVTRGALRTADTALARAVALDPAVPGLAAERVRVLTLSGRAAEALDLGKQVLPEVTGDDHAELCLRLARAGITAGQWAVAEEYVGRAGRPHDARSLVLAADAAFGSGRVADAAERAKAAVAAAEAGDEPDVLCEALEITARTTGGWDSRAVSAWRRAAQVAAEHGLPFWRIRALLGLALAEMIDDDATSLLEARVLAEQAGMLAEVASIDIMLCDHALVVEGAAAMQPIGERAIALTRRLGLNGLLAMAQALITVVHATRGDRAALERAERAAEALPEAPPEVAAICASARSILATNENDLDTAAAYLDAGMRPLVEYGAAAPFPLWGMWALLNTVADHAGAEQVRELVRASPAIRRRVNQAGLVYADAVARGKAGRHDEAVRLVAEGDALIPGQHAIRRHLRLVVHYAAVRDGWGDPVPGMRADLAAFEAAAEEGHARITRDLLRRAGSPTRRGRGDSPVPPALRALGITSREMDVLSLVVQGLSNAEVGDRLFLSTRTVETHVAHLLTKTGKSDRSQLSDYVRGLES